MRYLLSGTAVVGYSFAADTYGTCCVVDAVRAMHPGAFDGVEVERDAESVLSDVAARLGIDADDERSFDSGDFPKVIFALDADDDRCGACHEPLIG